MRLIKCILTANDCYKAGRTITPKGVMVHSTGANNPLVARYVQPLEGQKDETQLKAEIGTNRNANDWNNPGLDVCTHAFVGKLADGGVGTVQGAAPTTPTSPLRSVRTTSPTRAISARSTRRRWSSLPCCARPTTSTPWPTGW